MYSPEATCPLEVIGTSAVVIYHVAFLFSTLVTCLNNLDRVAVFYHPDAKLADAVADALVPADPISEKC
jgi:hypothetical protein